MIFLLAMALILILPVLGEQLAHFIEKIPQYFERVRQIVQEQSQGWLGRLVGDKLPDAQKQLGGVASGAAGWVAGFLTSLWSGGKALIGDDLAPGHHADRRLLPADRLGPHDRQGRFLDSGAPIARRCAGWRARWTRAISGFVRGQALVCLILGTFYSIALILLGVNFGLLIGITAAILGFAPYIGTLTGFLLAVGVATAQFWPDWHMPLFAAGIFVAGQFVEGNILQPFLVGKEIGLHPVWLMFALIAFGVLFGFVGLLVAVPVAAAIGVLVRFLLRQYLASPYYTGGK